jgi:hypothetical protein
VTLHKAQDIAHLPPAVSARSPAANLRTAFDLVELCYRLHPWERFRGVVRVGIDAEGQRGVQPER